MEIKNSIAAICLQKGCHKQRLGRQATDEQKVNGLDIADFQLMTENRRWRYKG